MKKIITILFLLIGAVSMAQQKTIDSTLVTLYPRSLDSISLNKPYDLDTTSFHANQFDLLHNNHTLYSTLSNIGLAHKAMRLDTQPIGFDLSIPAFNQYIKTTKDLKTYLSLLPYSEIRYVMTTGDKEQHLNFRFGRQVVHGLFLSLEYNINYSPSQFKYTKAENNYFWINTLYTTKNQRYRATAYWFRNKLEMQENGGILYDSVYSQHLEGDNAAILTNLNNATNYVKVSGVGFQHYFNLLSQFKQEKITDSDTLSMDTIATVIPTDTIKTRMFTLGRINHSFDYQRNQLFYNETSSSLPFYAPFDTVFSTKTTDTTLIHAFRNSLTWNSLGYKNYHDDVPFYLYAGINYDFYRIKQYNYLEDSTLTDRHHSQVILHGGVIMNLFGLTTVTGHAQLVTLGYQIGDFNLKGQWKQRISKKDDSPLRHISFGFDIDLQRKSPTWFETHYYSNHFRWDNDFHAMTSLSLDLHAQYKTIQAGVKNTTINDFIYFSTEARPTQHNGILSVSEIYGATSQHLWRFQFEGFFCFNFVNNHTLYHLPTFQSRLKVSYAQPIFKKAATLHPSITLHYFTKYYADAYMPALRIFYLQNDIRIGNYPFIDAALTINVKQADLYVMYSNMFLLTGNRDSFIAPHYPMRDSKIFIGINWRLFN